MKVIGQCTVLTSHVFQVFLLFCRDSRTWCTCFLSFFFLSISLKNLEMWFHMLNENVYWSEWLCLLSRSWDAISAICIIIRRMVELNNTLNHSMLNSLYRIVNSKMYGHGFKHKKLSGYWWSCIWNQRKSNCFCFNEHWTLHGCYWFLDSRRR